MKRQLGKIGPTSALRYSFEIPDPSQPIPEDERGIVGPSGQLMPFVPHAINANEVIGRRVDEVCPYLGTYGMGGAGFLGLRLQNEWLVFAIWGAGEWVRVDDVLVEDHLFEKYERPQPWIFDGVDNLSPKLVGWKISSLEIRARSLEMTFSNGMSLTIDESSEQRPAFEGNKEPREFIEVDDLQKAVFLAPTKEIWV